jgi:protease-4
MAFFRMVGGFFRGIWRALDGFRKVLHLVLLLFIFGVFFAAAARNSLPFIPARSALVIAPEGRIVEELSGYPFDRSIADALGEGEPETRLRDLLDVIDAARKDDRIAAMVLDLGALERAGLPALQDLAAAIGRFREAGKKVFAWGAWYDQRQYFLAAQADEVYVDPYGAVLIEGYGYFRQYLKGTADKLGVDVHVFKVGTHKSAPDTFTRADMSPEEREEARAWVGALWEAWKADVARARGLEPAALQRYADEAAAGVRQAGGDLAQYALASSLVTGLKTYEQFEETVGEEAGWDDDEQSFRSVDWRPYLTVLRSERALHKSRDQNVAVVVASGEILDGEQPPGTIGGATLSQTLRELRYDDSVDAIVLRIDSPGGSMYASELIRREIDALQEEGKPVVASMASVAASGGYYIAAPARRIFAAPTTITGSIGVYAMFPTFETTLGKIGVTSDGFGTTALSGAGRLDRNLNPQLGEVLQAGVEFAYRKFVGMVAEKRERAFDEVDGIAQGRVWSGADARVAGLVDEFGSVQDAIEAAAEAAGLEQGYGTKWIEPGLSWQEMLALRLRGSLAGVLDWVGLEPWPAQLPLAAPAVAEVRRLLELGERGRPLYWCPCRVE